VTTAGPLEGLRIVVTRAEEQAESLADRLSSLGADVLRAPAIAIVEPESWTEADRAIAALIEGNYDWIVFASVNAVTRFLGRMGNAGAKSLGGAKVGAVGRATARAVGDRGVAVDLVPATHTIEGLAAAMGPGTGRVLWPRVQHGPRDAVTALERFGWEVHEVAVYRNVPASKVSPGMTRVLAGEFDVITFASASAVRNVARVVPPDVLGLTPSDDPRRIVACIGPSTAAAARNLGYRVDVVAPEHSVEGLADALVAKQRGTIVR
jgi:uroporphyrinogen III methyltransferase/synthase